MQVTSEKINPYTHKVSVKESGAEIKKVRNHVLDDIREEWKVTWFRQGSEIPEEAIVRQYGEEFIMNRTLDKYLEKAYAKILRKLDIIPVASGNITSITSTDPLEFTLEIEVLPEVAIEEKWLKNIKVKKTSTKVEESEIDEEISAIEKRFTHYHRVGEKAHDGTEIQGDTALMGDRVTLSAQGYDKKDGNAIPETKVPSFPLILGSGAFIPWFEEKLVGAKEWEKVEFEITFPADYHSDAFKNRKVYFIVDIEKIEKPHTPTWDEAFIEGLRGQKTDLAGFREILRNEITLRKRADARRTDEMNLLEQLRKISTLEIGPALLAREVENVVREHRGNLEQQGLKLDDYLAHMQMSEEQYRETIVKPEAEQRLRGELILMKLQEILKIEVTDEEMKKEINDMIGMYSNPEVVARLTEKLIPGDQTFEDLKARTSYKKVIDSFLEE